MRFSRMTFIVVILAAGFSTARGQQLDPRAQLGPEGPETQRSQETISSERVGLGVYAQLEKSPDGRAYVIVRLRSVGRLNPARLAEHQAAVREREDAVLGRLAPGAFTVVYKFENIAAMTGYANAQGVAQLAADLDVVGVGMDARGHGTLAESVRFIEADIVRDFYCYTGEGITVAVLDTGIDANHPDLADDVAPGAYHFLHDPNGVPYSGPGVVDDNGHGTHVAGIITSDGDNNIAPIGVAPDADILPIKVLDQWGGGWMSDVALGVDHVVSMQGDYDRLAVINMSLASNYRFYDCPCDEWGDPNDPNDPFHWNGLLREALEAARDAGIVSFAASGNDADCYAMPSPACLSSVAAVAAVYDDYYGAQYYDVCDPDDLTTYPDLVTCFSNRNLCNELSAPGFNITAPWPPATVNTMWGTSMATPHCAGTAALMLEADPRWQLIPCIIRDNLRALGHPTDDECDWNPNPRRVNARRSVDAVARAPVEMAELLASDAAPGACFGYAVDIDDDVAVIGARLDTNQNGVDAGAAYVFVFDGSNWVEVAKLMSSDGYQMQEFGWSVAISGDTIIVGVPLDNQLGSCAGAAYVYVEPENGWDSVPSPIFETAKLLASDGAPGDSFGSAVDIDDDEAMVGAPWDNNSNGNQAGSVYVFNPAANGNGIWDSGWVDQKQRFLAPDGATDDHFGYSVALTMPELKAVIGAPHHDHGLTSAGSAYVFDYVGEWWIFGQELLASDRQAGDNFGHDVDMGFGPIIVGAPYEDYGGGDPRQNAGAAYIYFQPYQEPYFEQAKLLACDGQPMDFFGYSVGLFCGIQAVVGAPNDDVDDDDPIENTGSAYVFKWDENWTPQDPTDDIWFHQAKLRGSDGGPGDFFGAAVAMGATTGTIIVGAHDHGCMGPGAGAAYIFANPFKDCNGNGYPDWCDIENGTSEDTNCNGVPDECECVGDIDGDGETGHSDLGILLSCWGCCENDPCWDSCWVADLNCDGCVGHSDLGILLSDWGCEYEEAAWSEDFDDYALGSGMHGQGGWEGWEGDAAWDAYVTNAQSHSSPHSVDIVGNADLVHPYEGYTSGQWTYTAWQYVPTDFSGESYFILLNTYGAGIHNWSTQVMFSSVGFVQSQFENAELPLITGRWVELRVEIDLDADWQEFYYDGQLLTAKSWTDGVSGDGALNIGAVDLFANGASSVYYDDMSLR